MEVMSTAAKALLEQGQDKPWGPVIGRLQSVMCDVWCNATFPMCKSMDLGTDQKNCVCILAY